ncbi:MAG: hypothetical protein JWN86_4653 [Planctomycetota bacterium]|nr:hypothetical protein [Planctomycetota bacterium]
MPNVFAPEPPALPLQLWGTPPGLEQILMQEGVPFRKVVDPHPLAFGGGRFVLFDGRAVPSRVVRNTLSAAHVAIDVDVLRRESPDGDPFAALIDTRAARKTWTIDGERLTERVSRVNKAAIRRRLIARLRDAVARSGGVWARLAAYPHPYRSAFNFRADLDEPYPDDYARFARARRPIDDCSTHFVSTHAYGKSPAVMADLRRIDTQSHGHYHVVYRHDASNRRNLERADAILRKNNFTPEGFAAPEGRWTAGLDRVIEELGYEYASDFHLGHDDDPFFPWRDGRFSRVLQVPIHPICEGLFLDAGVSDPGRIARHLIATVRAKTDAGESAFVYGHPERRLGRFPHVVSALADAVADIDRLWRVTLTEFARWWRWRSQRTWSFVPKGDHKFEVQFDEWDARYPLALEIVRGDHVATIPLIDSRQMVRLSDLAYVRKTVRKDGPHPRMAPKPRGIRSALRAAIDWETVTPLHDLPEDCLRDRIKKRLRFLRATTAERNGGGPWR